METRELIAFCAVVLALSIFMNTIVSCTDHVNAMNHDEYMARLAKEEVKK